jgi:uncharacterized membrane protein YfcA
MDLLATIVAEITPGILFTLVVAGACIGVLAGIFGVGGGAISVPVFFETFRTMGVADDVAMPLAVGTSLAMIVPTSIMSAMAHSKKGTVDIGILKTWAVPVFLGVMAGSFIARFAEPVVFQTVFVFVAGVNSFKMLFGQSGWKLRDTMPGLALTALYGMIVGLLSALMGIGGGAISNLILTLNGKPIREAVSTSAGVGVIIAVPGAFGFVVAGWGNEGLPPDALGFVSLLALVLTVPTALLTTRLGVALAHKLPQNILGKLFGIFLALVCVRFLFEIFG